MRVISGTARGRKLVSPDGDSVRPTLDRVKESIFNMLSFSIADASVLDLFAGSGALGIEALSRGAKSAVFVDKSVASLSIVRQNLQLTHLEDKAICIQSDFASYLSSAKDAFNLIFLDPPYAAGFMESALALIKERKLLSEDGIILCESDSGDEFVPSEAFSVYRNKKYGKARILLMKEL
ncbi:MAG: 16S rRNA (guanine(966)-N(2))-methyltransferase RsmD [Clostridia bacterium]|nr:16S rRNA (guanine(966)-N(2))-methyltransferase RsmD [Clostridia bacterium]MBQ3553227.1 16S rRNA (guanine(966)-N(2))-methyltransferase RsmD [Clostridia bacterium]